ncbi:MAG: Asp/Glu racemase [Pseudomonadota bacterium]
MTRVPYTLKADRRPRLGLIVLQADETIEDEFRQIFDPTQVRLHVSRVASGAELTPETIHAMETALPKAVGLFPRGTRFDAVGYACTSGASLIGPKRVAALVRSACDAAAVTDPLTAAFAALHAHAARRIGIVSPYTPQIAQGVCAEFEAAGFEVAASLSFGEEVEANVAQISPASIDAAARRLIDESPLDAVFLSCTNLRTITVCANVAQDTGVPVHSSNGCLAWHMANLAGLEPKPAT